MITKKKSYLLPFISMASGIFQNELQSTEDVKIIEHEKTEELKAEYKLIQEKKSKLSRAKREFIIWKVEWMIKRGELTL